MKILRVPCASCGGHLLDPPPPGCKYPFAHDEGPGGALVGEDWDQWNLQCAPDPHRWAEHWRVMATIDMKFVQEANAWGIGEDERCLRTLEAILRWKLADLIVALAGKS